MKSVLLSLSLLTLSMLPGHGALLGYWDFNGSLNRSSGSMGALSLEFNGAGIGFEDYGIGTSVNLLQGFSAGSSQGFYSLAAIDETTRVTITNLDFTNLSTPTISFAVRNDALFQAGDDFYLEYNAGSGWVHATTFTDPGDTFDTVFYSFLPGVLDNVSSAGIRVTHSTAFTAVNSFEIDNLQIQALPEPAAYGACLAGLLITIVLLRRAGTAAVQ